MSVRVIFKLIKEHPESWPVHKNWQGGPIQHNYYFRVTDEYYQNLVGKKVTHNHLLKYPEFYQEIFFSSYNEEDSDKDQSNEVKYLLNFIYPKILAELASKQFISIDTIGDNLLPEHNL